MSLFSKIKKSAKKTVKKIAKSKLVKVGVAGACVVCPAVGAPLAAGIAVADKLSNAISTGSPKQKAAARKLLTATAKQAKKGDKDATRMLQLVAANNKAKKGNKAAQKVVAVAQQTAVKAVKQSKAADSKGIGTFQLMASGRIKKVA